MTAAEALDAIEARMNTQILAREMKDRSDLQGVVAALWAVLAVHSRGEEESQGYRPDGTYGYIEGPCQGCEAAEEYAVAWPCATVRIITAVLTTEVST